jgi:hypothetical protein
MYSDSKSILTANNCYEELNINPNQVLYNTLTLFQSNQLVLNIQLTNIARLIPAISPYFTLHIAFAKNLPVAKNVNILRAPILQSNFIIVGRKERSV